MVPTHCYQQQIGPQKKTWQLLYSINNIVCQTTYLPYTASTDGDETSVEVNIRIIINSIWTDSWSQKPGVLRRRSSAACLLRSWVQIPPGAWMFVCCECCVLSGRGFCKGLITRPEESYWLWHVVVCDEETSKTRKLKARYWAVKNTLSNGCNTREKKWTDSRWSNKSDKKKSYKLHNLISFAKWQGNVSKDDRAEHVVFQEEMLNSITELCPETLQEETICETKI